MGTTPNRGLPYPEDTDLVIAGDDAIQALAERLDAVFFTGHYVTVDQALADAVVTTGTRVTFPGPAAMHGFYVDDDLIVYAGTPRLFLVDVAVEIRHAAANIGLDEMASVSSDINLQVNGALIRNSHDRIDSSTDIGTSDVPTIRARETTHNLTVPIHLGVGHAIDVIAVASPQAWVGRTAIRILPIGPA